MASQNRTSVVSDIVKATFRAKASMSDAHWKEIGPSFRERTSVAARFRLTIVCDLH